MDITSSQSSRHSEQEFSKQLLQLIDAGAGVIHVRTKESLRAVTCIRKTILVDGGTYREWDVINGLREFSMAEANDESKKGDEQNDLGQTFQLPLGVIRDGNYEDKVRAYLYLNPQQVMENNPHAAQLVMNYSEYLPAFKACVILVTNDAPLPDMGEATACIPTLMFDTPSLSELRESLDTLLEDAVASFDKGVSLTEDDRERVCHLGAGMTRLQFETHVALAQVKALSAELPTLDVDTVLDEVQTGKVTVVNSSDILELYKSTDISEVGGMENLKEWIARRAECYSDEAKEYGVEPPKGIVLVGPPGTGKSLAGKAIASVLGVPLVRLDFGRVFSSLVGSSEARVRSALKMVESMAPCVLFVDEVDKGLGGITGGSSDSGVSTRVLGSFLTWLNDTKAPVFTMMTANKVDGLPPELLRKGRFDEIFSTSLPNSREREDVFEIHLGKRGRTLDKFHKDDIMDLLKATEGYVPAEIEAIVKAALVDAFSEREELGIAHLVATTKAMVPMSKSFAEQIEKMKEWSENNAVPVSKPEVVVRPTPPAGVAANARRVSTRNRRG